MKQRTGKPTRAWAQLTGAVVMVLVGAVTPASAAVDRVTAFLPAHALPAVRGNFGADDPGAGALNDPARATDTPNDNRADGYQHLHTRSPDAAQFSGRSRGDGGRGEPCSEHLWRFLYEQWPSKNKCSAGTYRDFCLSNKFK